MKSRRKDSIELSATDWIIPSSASIDLIYFYDTNQWKDNFLDEKTFVKSFERLIEFYPIISGSLKIRGEKGRSVVEFDDEESGLVLIVSSVSIRYSELNFPIDLINRSTEKNLFQVRLTKFSCGTIGLGFSMNHKIGDAHSFFQLIKDWSKIESNFDFEPSVCHDRSLLRAKEEEIEFYRTTNPNFDDRKSLKFSLDFPKFSLEQKLTRKTFRFNEETLKRMKNLSMKNGLEEVPFVSNFDVLAAFLFREIMIAREKSPETLTRIFISTNARPRANFPTNYFGNAIHFALGQVFMSKLLDDETLTSTSSLIHKAVKKIDRDEIRTTLCWSTVQPDVRHIQPTFQLNDADFSISAWNKMENFQSAILDNSFLPSRISLPESFLFNGAAILLSTELLDSSIDVILTLTESQMEKFDRSQKKFRENLFRV